MSLIQLYGAVSLLTMMVVASPIRAQNAVIGMIYGSSGTLSATAGNNMGSSETLTIRTEGRYRGIAEITLGERGDEPCYFRILGGDRYQGRVGWNECGANGPRTEKVVGAPQRWDLVALRFCHNSQANGQRRYLVKGVRATFARRPDMSATQDRLETVDELVQPNCRTWSQEVRCAPGTAAPEIILRHIAIGGRRGLVGARLNCVSVDSECYAVPEEGIDVGRGSGPCMPRDRRP